ncbi:MAG: fibronectin type III domain-containing protein [Thermoplasmata archaeon]
MTGTVFGYFQSNATSTPVPISGDTVDAVESSCVPFVNSLASCTPNATATTGPSGGYSLSLPNGTYDVYSSPVGEYGGDWTTVTVRGTAATAPTIDSFFELTYTNTTFDLPGFTSLSGYIDDHSDTQIPVLSYTSDGTFYVNSSGDLVFYSFPDRSIERIAPWDMLYDQIGYVGELNNYFYLTFDGSYAYEMGCATPRCSSPGALTVYAVNVTTGRSFIWNTGVSVMNTPTNAQVNLVGRNGNDSLMSLVTSNGTIRLYNPWNGTAWIAGTIPYFEANNIYWVPFLNSFVNVEAGGSTADEVEQLELEGPGSGTSFVPVFGPVVNGPGGIKSNGVNGLAFNLTLDEMSYDYGSSASGTGQTIYSFADGVLSTQESYVLEKGIPYGRFVADDHRLAVTTGAPLVNAYYDPNFYNQSWVNDPFTGQYFDTNIQEGFRNPSEPNLFDSAAGFDGEAAHQFLNASTAITAYSVNCASVTGAAIECPLLGTTPGTKLGTIYYVSELPAGSYPYPATAPLAQDRPPPPLVLSETSDSSSVTVTWGAPSIYPVLNYTFYWGFSPSALTQHVNLASDDPRFTISGLFSDEQVYYGATVTDLNFMSPLASGAAATTGPPALGPTGLIAKATSAREVDLSWTNPPGPVINDTMYYSTGPSGPFTGESEGAVTSALVTGLSPGTEYFFEVAAWNSSVQSPRSNEASATTFGPPPAPTGLAVASVASSAVTIGWVNPAGPLLNDTAFYAMARTGPFTAVSEGVTTSAKLEGLAPNTTYYFGVTAWNSTGESATSSLVLATTLVAGAPFPPSAPTDLNATTLNETSVRLSWTPPPGTLVGYTAFFGNVSGDYTVSDYIANGTTSSYNVTGLTPSTTYYFVVRAWGVGGPGNLSQMARATTASPPPTPGTGSQTPAATFWWLYLPLMLAVAVALMLVVRRITVRRGKGEG